MASHINIAESYGGLEDDNYGVNVDSSNDAIPCNTIFIGPISVDMNEEDIRILFEEYGQIEKVSIVLDRRTLVPKGNDLTTAKIFFHFLNLGCAFVTYVQYHSVEKAVGCAPHNISINNVPIYNI